MKVPQPRKLASGNYSIQLRLDGKSISITRRTAKECKDAAALVKAEYNAKKVVVECEKPVLKDAIENYISKRSSVLSPSTIRGYRVIKKNYFQSVMENRIDAIDWQAEINSMAKEYAPKTVKNAWRFISSVLSENGLERKKIALPKIEINDKAFLSGSEIQTFIKALKGSSIDVQIAALLGLHSLRRSEIAALDWQDIDMKKQTIHIHGASVPDENGKFVLKKTAKNDSSTRKIPIMIPMLYDALKSVDDKSGKVCKIHPNSIYKAVNSICEKNGLPLVGVHGLRRSFTSLAYNELHLTEMQTMELGGWSDFGTMRKIYTQLDNSAKEDARNKMKNYFATKTLTNNKKV